MRFSSVVNLVFRDRFAKTAFRKIVFPFRIKLVRTEESFRTLKGALGLLSVFPSILTTNPGLDKAVAPGRARWRF